MHDVLFEDEPLHQSDPPPRLPEIVKAWTMNERYFALFNCVAQAGLGRGVSDCPRTEFGR
jgi:hypothetical protein